MRSARRTTRLSPTVCALVLATMAFFDPEGLQAQTGSDHQQVVLITGASSGIGRKTAELFASRGFFVYAGARKARDIAELNAIENIEAIRLDVTVQSEINAAVEVVTAAGRGLDGLINNAGVVVLAPLIELTEADLDFQMDVNVWGPYRVTKAFAPLLIESKGRVSTTGSISGIVTFPLGGPYTMSKHAVEAFSATLAGELAPFDVKVSVVEPGNYQSQIIANTAQRLVERGYTTDGSRYKGMMDQFLDGPTDRAQYQEPDDVAEAFFHAMTDVNPKSRYLVVPTAQEAEVTILAAIRTLVQLNQDHAYTYGRDELIGMLDQALASSQR